MTQPVDQEALLIRPEPPWRYGLAEVIFQFLEHNGDLPLLSGHHFMRARNEGRTFRGRPKFQAAGELDIFGPDGAKSELDIVIAYGTELWVGEATTVKQPEKSKDDELNRLARLREVSEVLCARGVLLISGSNWVRNTRSHAQRTFSAIWPRLEIVESGRQAYRWTPPPADSVG